MENDLSEVFNLSKVNFKNEMKQIYDSSDMNKGILVDFTKLYHLIEEWIIKRKTSRFNLFDTDSTIRARKTLAKIQRFSANHVHNQKSLRQCQYTFN